MRPPKLYFIVKYCPDCLKGTVIDMVREVSKELPDAHKLGVKRAQRWDLDCQA